MAQQQKPNFQSRLLPILVIYGLFFLGWQFFGPKGTSTPTTPQSLLQQARELETAGKKEDPNVALADRIKQLDGAALKYEEFWNNNRESKDPEILKQARQSRFDQVNLYNYLAVLETQKGTNTHWLDVAETKLKDMEKTLHRRDGEVKILRHRREGTTITAQSQDYKGDLGQASSLLLNEIRLARDDVRKSNLTYIALHFLVTLCGGNRAPHLSYFLALLLVVVVLKTATFPLLVRQYKSQKDMARVAPLIKEEQERLKAANRPPEEINKRIFEIYRENNVNLMGGCLPMLVLMFALWPVFFMVKDYEYQFTNATFLWIGSETSKNFWWMADNLAQFDVILYLIYILSMVFYSLLQPKPTDPQQAQTQKIMLFMMPVMMAIFMWQGQWSSAFMLYWLILNIVSMYQSWVLMKKFGLASALPGSAGEARPAEADTTAPEKPLTPMKSVHTPSKPPAKNGKGARNLPATGKVRPRGARKE